MASNHSFESFDKKFDPFQKESNQAPPDSGAALGATGNFPNGKLSDNDEGELQFAVFKKDETIIIEFGKAVKTLGLTPEQAIEIAKALCKHAGVPMTIEIPSGEQSESSTSNA